MWQHTVNAHRTHSSVLKEYILWEFHIQFDRIAQKNKLLQCFFFHIRWYWGEQVAVPTHTRNAHKRTHYEAKALNAPFFPRASFSRLFKLCGFFFLSISQLFIHVVYNYLLLFGWWVVRDGVCVCVPEYLVYSAFVTASVSGSLMCVRKFFSVCQSKFTFTYWWIRPRGRSLNCVQT